MLFQTLAHVSGVYRGERKTMTRERRTLLQEGIRKMSSNHEVETRHKERSLGQVYIDEIVENGRDKPPASRHTLLL